MYLKFVVLTATLYTIPALADPKEPGLSEGPNTEGYYQFPNNGPGDLWVSWYKDGYCTDRISSPKAKGGAWVGFPTDFNPHVPLPEKGFSYTINRDLVEGERLDFSSKDGVRDPCGRFTGTAQGEWRKAKGECPGCPGRGKGCHFVVEGADCQYPFKPSIIIHTIRALISGKRRLALPLRHDPDRRSY